MSRCLIYKVHAALLRREFILPSRFALVKHFFQVFQNFLKRSTGRTFRLNSPAALADDLFILPPPHRFVKGFFKSFFDLFPSTPLGAPSCRTASIEYHTHPHLSSTFFRFFLLFSLPPLPRPTCPPAEDKSPRNSLLRNHRNYDTLTLSL